MQSIVSQLRFLLRHLFVYALYVSGALARAKKRICSSGGTVVLTLHRILPDNERAKTLSPPGMIISEPTFARLVSYLCTEHQPVPLSVSRNFGTAGGRIPVAITFDDGWADNATYAYPILALQAAPATIFLCPEKMGQNLPFWPERLVALFREAARVQRTKEFLQVVVERLPLPPSPSLLQVIEVVKHLPPTDRDLLLECLEKMFTPRALEQQDGIDSTMTWEVARQLSAAGVAFGSHTLHHEILTRIPFNVVREELTRSRERVNAEIGQVCSALAYPNGDWSSEVRDVTASVGYALAFANSPGIWLAKTDLYAIPRINLWEGAITGIRGRFSKPHFDYVVFWRALRASRN